jgi:Uncharacterized conserved protein (COG2071)
MNLPTLHGVIDRRVLANYRVNPDVLQALLPPPFHPKLVRGVGIAGICLIRLRDIRPAFVPSWLGFSSENAAHRIAVEWRDDTGRLREGVYIPRRDTSSRLNSWTGGRLFPGFHHHARFTVHETADRFEIALRSDDDGTRLSLRAVLAAELPRTSVFESLPVASAFFEAGSLGYSATPDPRRFQGLELHCLQWQVEPLAVEEVHSSFFENPVAFPPGSVEFDCALLMRGIRHAWHAREDLCCPVEAVVPVVRPEIVGTRTAAILREVQSNP